MRIPIVTAASLTLLAALAPAAQAAPREAAYTVVFEAHMTERWSFKQFSSRECENGPCVTDEQASGVASAHLKTPTPQRVRVMTGMGPSGVPMIVGTTDGTLRVTGGYLRTGSHTVSYSGDPAYDAANPDETQPTEDCGRRTARLDVGLGFQQRNRISPSVPLEPLRERCPSGPPRNLQWDGGEVPDVNALAVAVAQSKFGRAKQFTVRGARTWHGTVDPFDRTDPQDTFHRSGEHTVTWQWRATFRKARRRR
jgi:hypothetical protein